MSSSSLLVSRAEFRRWPQLLQVVLLVAFVGATVATALVGAHRTTTAADRLRTELAASDAVFQSQGQFHADGLERAARDLDEVTGVAQRHLVNVYLGDGAISDIAIMSDPADRYGREIDRPRILEGRMPAPDAPDEVLLNELAATWTGLGVGDRFGGLTWNQADLEALFAEAPFPGFNGPQLDLVVVGIGRTLDELPGELQRTTPYAIGSASFLGAHPGIGAWPPAVLVELAHGEDGVGVVAEALGAVPVGVGDDLGPPGHYDPGETAQAIYLDTVDRTANSLAVGLVVFALAASLVGAIVLGQAVIRHLAGASAPAVTLRQLGESRRGIALGAAVPIGAAAAIGAAIGVATAAAASPILPIGLVRRVEPDPGVTIDPWVSVTTVLVVAAAVTAFAAWSASRERRWSRTGGRATAGAGVRIATSAGAPPAVVAGIRLAVDHGTPPLPNRTAFVALAVAVAGVVGASVVDASNTQVSTEPARWGQNWSSQPDTFDEDVDPTEADERLATDRRLDGVGRYRSGSVSLGGRAITAHSIVPLAGDVSFSRRSGRLPSGPGEIALGARTMRDLDVSIGDTVPVVEAATEAERELTVVGTVVLPYDENQTLDEGAVLTPDAFDRFVLDEPDRTLVLVYPPDADRAELESELADDYGLTFTALTQPTAPGAVANLAITGRIARALALFFVALATISTVHTLSVAGRRRRGDLAIMRALGSTGGAVRVAVLCQGFVLGVVSLVLGVPAGVVVGRLVWHLVSADVGAIAPPVVPIGLTLAVVPVTLVAISLLAWWPGRVAARRSPARDLRSE